MRITVYATKTDIDGDCERCAKKGKCRILAAAREYALCENLTFDCPYADLKDEG